MLVLDILVGDKVLEGDMCIKWQGGVGAPVGHKGETQSSSFTEVGTKAPTTIQMFWRGRWNSP